MKQRPYSSSEVLFIEALYIAKRRSWRDFAIDLLVERARQHSLALARACEIAEVVYASAPQSESKNTVLLRLEELKPEFSKEFEALLIWSEKAKKRTELPPVGRVIRAATRLLNAYSARVSFLTDDDRSRMDQDIERLHRGFVVLGKAASSEDGVLEAEMGQLKDQTTHPLHAHALAGLALSGGGIRSASFAIGALQAMSSKAVLPVFDYISSVSGGGYAASWLAAWAYRHKRGIRGVEQEMFQNNPYDAGPLYWVRRYTSYLAPRTGFGSSDLWALLVAYIFNWIPILFLTAAALLFLLLIPHCVTAIADTLAASKNHDIQSTTLLVAAILIVAFLGLLKRLTLYHREPGGTRRPPNGLAYLIFWGALLVSIYTSVSSLLLPAYIQRHGLITANNGEQQLIGLEPFTTILLLCLAANFLAWAFAAVLSSDRVQSAFDAIRNCIPSLKMAPRGPLKRIGATPAELVLSTFAHSLVASILILAFCFDSSLHRTSHWMRVALGPLTVVTVIAIAEIFGMLFTTTHQRDVDRAWASRVGAWTLTGIVVWTVLCLLSLGGSALLTEGLVDRSAFTRVPFFIFLVAIFLAFPLAKVFGFKYLLNTYIIGATALTLQYICTLVIIPGPDGRVNSTTVLQATLLSLSLVLFLAATTNVNRYSLHAIYKDGLVRTFLGASRLGHRNTSVSRPSGVSHDSEEAKQFSPRRPEPVTDIDDDDNPMLAWLISRPERELPILLLNAAINGMNPSDLDGRVPRQWPFTFSQHFTGSPATGIGYAPTANFFSDNGRAGGLSLGAAMAVSGAAMSPTSGKTTRPLSALVLGILNARLGIWIGNPQSPASVRRTKPPLGGFTVLREMFGLRAAFGEWIHLSDGGHFENIGVYELIRRGCRRIVVVDASCDPERSFDDLADAIRRARIDLGVKVFRERDWEIFGPSHNKAPTARFETSDVGPSSAPSFAALQNRSWTWFEVDYGAGLPLGRILYVKPSIYYDEVLPVEIKQYWAESSQFPHESTADQFFTEKQMDAYRSLGELCMKDALRVLTPGAVDSHDVDADLRRLVRRSL